MMVDYYLNSPLLPGRSMLKIYVDQLVKKSNYTGARTEQGCKEKIDEKLKDCVRAKNLFWKTADKKTSQGEWTK